MKYRLLDGREIDGLHYRVKPPSLFDTYDEDSLAILSELIGLEVVSASDRDYSKQVPYEGTKESYKDHFPRHPIDVTIPKHPRKIMMQVIMQPPFYFHSMEFYSDVATVVDVLEDEPKTWLPKTKQKKLTAAELEKEQLELMQLSAEEQDTGED